MTRKQSWHAERAKRKGGSNVRGSKEPWERSYVPGYQRRDGTRVAGYYRHKGKRR